jgi:hypothetical protein
VGLPAPAYLVKEAVMGTWSVEPFGNDDAVDWADELKESNDPSLVQEAIDAVLAVGDEYLEAPDAAVAVAAIDADSDGRKLW